MPKHADRAKQFMPFAALTGYYSLVEEKEVINEPRKERTEEENIALSQKALQLYKGMKVKIKYYRNGGYTSVNGIISEVNLPIRYISVDNLKIPLDDIYEIEKE